MSMLIRMHSVIEFIEKYIELKKYKNRMHITDTYALNTKHAMFPPLFHRWICLEENVFSWNIFFQEYSPQKYLRLQSLYQEKNIGTYWLTVMLMQKVTCSSQHFQGSSDRMEDRHWVPYTVRNNSKN